MPGNGLRFSLARRLVVTLAVLVMMLPGLALSALPDLIERVKPSVVAVGTFDRTRSPAFILRGTGFVLGNGNLVATNAHVIPESLNASGSEAVVIRLTSSSGEVLQRVARVAASDKSHDLALLRIEGVPMQAIPLHNGVVRETQIY